MTKIEERIKAQELVINNNLTQKEVSKILNVSEKTMSHWAKKFKWNEKKSDRTERVITIKNSLSGFLNYINDAAPDIHSKINELQKNYIKTISI